MTPSPVDGGDHEVLSVGPGSPGRLPGRGWVIAAACLAAGATAGVVADDALDARRDARDGDAARPELVAGVIQEQPDPVGDLLFAVPVFNNGAAEVTVDSVSAEGWVPRGAGFRAVTIPPASWAMVSLPVEVDCDAIGSAAPDSLTVETTTPGGTFDQRLAMPAPSRVLGDAGWRVCLDPRGSVPTADDLYGSWLVEEAGRFRRTVVRLREGGTFAVDPDVFAFGADLNAVGTFTRSGAQLRLTAGGGRDCQPGDRTTWVLTLLDDGRLHIRHRPTGDTWCRIDDGEVWVARRIIEPFRTRTTP